jgi:hypothetical protein
MKKYRFCSKQPDIKLLLSERDSHKIGCETGRVQIRVISRIPLFGSQTVVVVYQGPELMPRLHCSL